MNMKKFYSVILASVLLLNSINSKAQTVYNSILDNSVTNYTLDDPRFWGGTDPFDVTPAPPANCSNCIINIFTSVIAVPQNGGTVANGGTPTSTLVVGGNAVSLNHITLTNGSRVNVYGNTKLIINTWLTLKGSSIVLGNDPTSIESIDINDEVDIDAASSIQLANNQTSISVLNLVGRTNILGPYNEIGNNAPVAGIYGIRTAPVPPNGALLYSQILGPNGVGSDNQQYFAPGGEQYYTYNCTPTVPGAPNDCGFGLVFGPVVTTNGGSYGVIFVGSGVLPVSLVQLLATKADDGSNQLKWTTSQEQNASNYEIERSSDQTGWTKIGTVKAKGFSSTATNYNYTDRLPLSGSSYYHLRMNDIDGKFTYSKTVVVSSDNSNQPLVVYNNPFTDQIRLKVNVGKAQNLILTVSDLQGKTYLTQSYNAQAGDNLISLQPSAGSGAMYILKINGNTYSQTVKLQKQ